MTGRIIPLRGHPHERIQSLLPWFVTGRLDPDERAEVETHLSGCPDCRAEESLERRLAAEVATMPMDVAQSWERLRARLERPSATAAAGPAGGLRGAWREFERRLGGGPAWVAWAMAAQAVVMVLLVGAVWPRPDLTVGPGSAAATEARAAYHALGSAPTQHVGNVLVMFRPDVAERDMRAAFLADQARLVDGPTTAGAYVLSVPGPRRAAVLSDLRRRAGVTMAEPIDPPGTS